MIDFSKFKVRCHKISTILSDSRQSPSITEKQLQRLKELEDKKNNNNISQKQELELAELLLKQKNSQNVILSDGYISYLCEEYSYLTTGKINVDKKFLSLHEMEKGTIVELESIAILSMVDGVMYTPNTDKERISNEYLTGEVDAYLGETIMNSEKIPDIKSIWDYPTFLKKIVEPISLANKLQVQGYLDITGAREGFIANVLTNTPGVVLNSLKWKLLNKLGSVSEEAKEFKEAWEVVYKSMVFDDIPLNLRVSKSYVDKLSEFERNKVYDRVKQGREWLYNFHEMYNSVK